MADDKTTINFYEQMGRETADIIRQYVSQTLQASLNLTSSNAAGNVGGVGTGVATGLQQGTSQSSLQTQDNRSYGDVDDIAVMRASAGRSVLDSLDAKTHAALTAESERSRREDQRVRQEDDLHDARMERLRNNNFNTHALNARLVGHLGRQFGQTAVHADHELMGDLEQAANESFRAAAQRAAGK